MRRIAIAVAVPAVAAAVFVLVFVRPDVMRYRMPAESMVPTIAETELFDVNTDAYDSGDPQIGDIVVLHPPRGMESGECGRRHPPGTLCPAPTEERADVRFVKRVVAGPGDRLRIRDGRVIRDGRRAEEPYAQPCGPGGTCTFRGEITIPPDHWFMLGDNRGTSDDSRFWGPVPREWIVGRVDECGIANLSCSPRR